MKIKSKVVQKVVKQFDSKFFLSEAENPPDIGINTNTRENC